MMTELRFWEKPLTGYNNIAHFLLGGENDFPNPSRRISCTCRNTFLF